ncbi:hypothetical protein Syun_003707 [Stephania yunnanensis]|uniref:Uncharacterized protein n=1 Tax=Stephania yunnanensis TaxID=152371 RepID=A0AAP0Q0U1_9MAGN
MVKDLQKYEKVGEHNMRLRDQLLVGLVVLYEDKERTNKTQRSLVIVFML